MKVDKADLEAKLREIESVVDETRGSAQGAVLLGVVVVVAIALIFLLGRRKGKKGSARVEVYRVG